MAQIKITSNPYEKEIEYNRFDELTDTWVQIDTINNKNSKLISNELTTGFFPFKVKQIVDNIIKEYDDGEDPIIIEFEGTDDEYEELRAICSNAEYDGKTKCKKSVKYIENAREILPDIINIFSELKPIISDSIGEDEIALDLKRFSDASSDVIPICVIGNYSAGKSTFINALIGNEILPSGENPVTAKVFKITNSKDCKCSSISFTYNGEQIKITLSSKEFHIENYTENDDLVDKIKDILTNNSEKSLSALVNNILSLINDFSSELETDPIGNMIEVEVPFNSYITQNVDNPFIIFDTPGSNSASNVKHQDVLKDAMNGMSNGIPVFISEYSKLDTTDNKDLFNIINGIDNLDNRFTMIVVNKADIANLPSKGFSKEDENKILRLFIPENLYSGGIYFVSSVMGLGSKINGNFTDENSIETFESQKEKYSNPADKYYKTLYKYNIMPEQIKRNAVTVAASCNNTILANSGLFSLENEIAIFAKKYSSYDKCTQSQNFLKSILDKTTSNLESKKAEVEKRKIDSVKLFEQHKQSLIDKLDSDEENLFNKAKNTYAVSMNKTYHECCSSFNKEELENRLENIEMRLKSEKEYDALKSDKSSSQKELLSNIRKNSKNIINEKLSKESIKQFVDELSKDRKNIDEDSDELRNAKKEISELASKELLQNIIDKYQKSTENAQILINKASIDYWKSQTIEAKNVLLATVSDSKGINEDEQSELSKIILEYPEITLFENKAKDIFTLENFRKKLVIDKTIRLKIEKLAKTYNEEITKFIEDVKMSAESDHSSGFHSWIEALLSKLRENIVSYNQILRDEQLLIGMLEKEIKQLEEKRNCLLQGSAKIEEMMLWKEI